MLTEGIDNIPDRDGYLIIFNHYARPGFNTAWIALALANVIPDPIHFIMSEAWAFEGNPFGFLLRRVMRYVLANITRAYEFLPMPAMVEGYSDAKSRAAAVRRVILFSRMHPHAVIGLAPEGKDSPPGDIGLAPTGGGKFILYLNRMGLPILTVFVTEKSGRLVIKIGELFNLPDNQNLRAGEVDTFIRAYIQNRLRKLSTQILDNAVSQIADQ